MVTWDPCPIFVKSKAVFYTVSQSELQSPYWKLRIAMMSTVSSLVAPDVVIMTIPYVSSDDKVSIILIPSFQYRYWISFQSLMFSIHVLIFIQRLKM